VPTLSNEFEIVWSVETRCKDCGASTVVYDDVETVIRVTAGNNSIEDQLANLTEWSNNGGVCTVCGGACEKRRVITGLPSNLLIHINRFNDDGTKSFASLKYTEPLDMALQGEARGSRPYELKAVAMNPGQNNGTGHFFGSFFEPLEERWYVCDDDKVTLSEGPRLSDQDAVLLVYQVGVGAGVLSGGV
jgi:ubiquitin C-terminal hydrolase